MPNASSAWPCVMVAVRVEFRGSEDLARPPANPPQMPDGSAWPWCGVQKFKVQKARSSEGSAGRKSVNEFKNGKSACLCVRRMSAAPCAPSALPPSGRRTGRDGTRGSPRKGRAAENFRPLQSLMISWPGGRFFLFPHFCPLPITQVFVCYRSQQIIKERLFDPLLRRDNIIRLSAKIRPFWGRILSKSRIIWYYGL